MLKAFNTAMLGFVLATAAAFGAAADKMEISPYVYDNYQEFLKKISGFDVAVFAVSENGLNSFYVYCDQNCSMSSLAKQAVDGCEQRGKIPCKVLAVNHDQRIEFEVYNETKSLSSNDQILANRFGAEKIRGVVGNTIRGEYPNGVKWAEYYDPSGETRGHDKTHGDYTAHYTVKEDQICYDYPGNDDDWCAQLSDGGDQIYFLKDGELVTFIRNASIVTGNPDNL